MQLRLVVCSVLAVGLAGSHARAQNLVRIASPVDGIIQEVFGKPGDKVLSGQILAKLDDRLARVEVEIAQAKLQGADARTVQAEADIKLAEARSLRAKALVKTNVISQEELLSAQFEVDKARAGLEIQKAQMVLARLNMKKAQIILDMHVLRASAAGTLRRLTRRPGEGIAARELFAEIEHDENKK